MGAPKQKWTAEEEAALKAGVVKHGPGKWRTILKDPEFSSVLSLRSNVDLKDKWRNMTVVANGGGSRERARLAMKRFQMIPKHDDKALALSTAVERYGDDIIDAKPLGISNGMLQITGSKKSISRLDNLIVEAITSLKEPSGCNRTAIAVYIEEQYGAPPNFKSLLSSKLKALTASGKLIKVKRKYRIAPNPSAFLEGRSSGMLMDGGRHRDLPRVAEKDEFRPLTKSQIDADLAKLRNMTAAEAGAVVAQAVAEAEAAMLAAEEAMREAEEAEADAEAAQAFAEAALMTLKSRASSNVVMVPG